MKKTIIFAIAVGIIYYIYKRKNLGLNGTSLNNPLKIPEKGFTKDPGIKPPYPKLYKPESTSIHFKKGSGDH